MRGVSRASFQFDADAPINKIDCIGLADDKSTSNLSRLVDFVSPTAIFWG